jgi:glucose/arabinose dehydrogenase
MTTPGGEPSRASKGRGLRVGLMAFLLAAAALSALPGTGAATPDWDKAKPVPVVEGLAMPADIEVAPDGAIWYIELEGDVSRFDPKAGTSKLVHHVEDVVTGGERGLVGFALAKDFAESGAYFLYYTKRTDDPAGGLNHLVRVDDGVETVLLTVPGAKEHNGGRIVVDKDGNLFVGTGENQLRDPAQDAKSLLGKILHLTPDGKPVAGNMDGFVYAKGIRNPYGLAIHPETGELWETENSGWRRDEVNLIKAGGNYGYPECEGFGLNGVDTPCPTNKGYIFPVRTFYEKDAVAPTGATFWRGEFYWGSINEGSIHHTWQDPATKEWHDAIVLKDQMPVLDLAVGPDDILYVATVDGILGITLPDVDLGNKPVTGGQDGGGGGDEADLEGGSPARLDPGDVQAAPAEAESKGAAASSFVLVGLALAVGLVLRRTR